MSENTNPQPPAGKEPDYNLIANQLFPTAGTTWIKKTLQKLRESPTQLSMLLEGTEYAEKVALGKLSLDCFWRGIRKWQEKHPDADYLPDGADNIEHLLNLIDERGKQLASANLRVKELEGFCQDYLDVLKEEIKDINVEYYRKNGSGFYRHRVEAFDRLAALLADDESNKGKGGNLND